MTCAMRISPARSRTGQNGEFPLLQIQGTDKKSDKKKGRKKYKQKEKKQTQVETANGKVANGKLKNEDHGKENGIPSETKKKCWEEKLDKSSHVILDVGGERYRTSRDVFLKFPNTRLGKLMISSDLDEILTLCEEYTPSNPPEYFFDKNPTNFALVMEMYRSGKLHIPDGEQGRDLIKYLQDLN